MANFKAKGRGVFSVDDLPDHFMADVAQRQKFMAHLRQRYGVRRVTITRDREGVRLVKLHGYAEAFTTEDENTTGQIISEVKRDNQGQVAHEAAINASGNLKRKGRK